MHSKENWDDLRFVLAVAKAGSVSGAARQLGVNHATVLRRIAAFEDRYSTEVFDKTLNGYAISPESIRVIDAAKEVENAVLAVERLISGTQVPLRGLVRITSTDTFCQFILPPILAQLPLEAHELRVDLLATNAHLDLGKLAADISVRPAVALEDNLSGEVVGRLAFGVYARKDCDPERWLGLSGGLARSVAGSWVSENVKPEQLVAAADSFLILKEFAAIGNGQAVLPCVLGDSDPRLERRFKRSIDMGVNIWVACHNDLADVPRIRVVRRFLVKAMRAQAHRLAGRLR